MSILRKKLVHRVIESGRFLAHDFYDFAWAAEHDSRAFLHACDTLSIDDFHSIENRCVSIARSKKSQSIGPPVLAPADKILASRLWEVCATLFNERASAVSASEL